MRTALSSAGADNAMKGASTPITALLMCGLPALRARPAVAIVEGHAPQRQCPAAAEPVQDPRAEKGHCRPAR
ncbi:hypothetical protein ACH34R_26265 [Spongiactinospora sp. 9N601]